VRQGIDPQRQAIRAGGANPRHLCGAAATRCVDDDHLLADLRLQVLGQGSDEHVRGAARCRVHDHVDGTGGAPLAFGQCGIDRSEHCHGSQYACTQAVTGLVSSFA